ncbi:MAG: FAD binding domain-containing protein [Candidatus Krumholzibacteriia bacterium]
MIPGLGAYYRPDRLEEALALLARQPQARILAGGTDLLLEKQPVGALVDVTRLGLDTLCEDDGALVLGATLTIERLLQSDLARTWADGILVGACLHFGTLQVRNMATVGGNIAHGLPAADLVPALIALDAQVRLARIGASRALEARTVPLDGFATGPFETVLAPGELLVEVRLPARARQRRAQFRKIGRVLKDLAQVNCAVALEIEDDTVREARIVVGAVHPTVTRVTEAEAELRGAAPLGQTWERCLTRVVEVVRSFVRPITDLRATREWRRHVCGVLVRRSLEYAGDPTNAGRFPRYEDGPLYRVGAGGGR